MAKIKKCVKYLTRRELLDLVDTGRPDFAGIVRPWRQIYLCFKTDITDADEIVLEKGGMLINMYLDKVKARATIGTMLSDGQEEKGGRIRVWTWGDGDLWIGN